MSDRMSDEELFASMAPGYKFQPRDEEVVLHYLTRKINNLPLPPNRIHVLNFYDYKPEFLAERFKPSHGKNEWYFFSSRERKYPKGSRPNRAAGDGYWRATGRVSPIEHNGHKIGSTQTLVFIRGKQTDKIKNVTGWTMTEFVVENAPSPLQTDENKMKLDDWVVCKMFRSAKPRGTKRKRKAAKDNDMDPITEEAEIEIPNHYTDEVIMDDNTIRNLYQELPDEQIQCDQCLQFPYSHGSYEQPAATLTYPQPLDPARFFNLAVQSNDQFNPQAGFYPNDVQSVPFVHQPELMCIDSCNFSAPTTFVPPMHPWPPTHSNSANLETVPGPHYPNVQSVPYVHQPELISVDSQNFSAPMNVAPPMHPWPPTHCNSGNLEIVPGPHYPNVQSVPFVHQPELMSVDSYKFSAPMTFAPPMHPWPPTHSNSGNLEIVPGPRYPMNNTSTSIPGRTQQPFDESQSSNSP